MTKTETLQSLIHIAVDLYNDTRVETLSARSWTSRSLSSEFSDSLTRQFEKEGMQSKFVPFSPCASAFHYRDPLIYEEMTEIVASLEKGKHQSSFEAVSVLLCTD